MQLLRWNNPEHNTTRAPLWSVGLDVANPTHTSGAGRKMFLTCPLIDQAITRFNPTMSEIAIYRQQHGKKGLAAKPKPRLADLPADSPVFDLQN
jgi:hypothetical protein